MFNDPADWYRDLQITIDILLGGGVVGRLAPHATVPVFFSNPDLLWANEHPTPRFGQGGFKTALEALYLQVGVALSCKGMQGDARGCKGMEACER